MGGSAVLVSDGNVVLVDVVLLWDLNSCDSCGCSKVWSSAVLAPDGDDVLSCDLDI